MHSYLVKRAERWLRGTQRCSVVLIETNTSGLEHPDAIGWGYQGESVLIECKATRSDFLAEAKKPFRSMPTLGMGRFRYYMTPPGLLQLTEIPDGWGLLEVDTNRVRVKRKSSRFELGDVASKSECMLLTSAVNRVTEGWSLKVFGDLRPTLVE